jgi:serine protease Do
MAMTLEALPGLGALSGALAEVAARLRPSVVSVRSEGRGHGAGVIWAADGLVVTNAHVVPDDRATVVLDGGRELPARLIARDPAVDLAALRVDASGLPAAPVGDSTALRVGQLVFAIGHPLGEPHAVALGIVSDVGRAIHVGRQRLSEAVQADLTLYPGNSGGPMADAQGRVIGINSMVVPPRLALAVPTATVQRFLTVGSRARIGVRTQRVALPPPLLRRLGRAREYALMVVDVLPNEPAAAAGLLPGDVLLAVGDRLLDHPDALAAALDAAAGEAVWLRVLRGGAEREIAVVPRSVG